MATQTALTLEEAKAQRGWNYNFGQEYAHTSCLHFSEVADINIKAPSPAKAEPLVKWPEEKPALTPQGARQ